MSYRPHPAPAPEMNAIPAGKVSVTVTAAVVGPLLTLVATKVQTPSWPSTNAVVWRLSSARSGSAWTRVESTARSFAAFRSPAPETTAVFTAQGKAAKATPASSVKRALSPAATMRRGYAIVQRTDGHVVRAPADVNEGDALRLRLAEGELAARVASS